MFCHFQDGATQLQFCSDKCLNQYKMHIFCRETQAHLDLNPHLVNASSSSNLITPDLWLKNCKSRSVSPTSERSASPCTDKNPINDKIETTTSQRKSPKPLITIAPPAKLMNPKPPEERPIQKSPETKKDMRNTKINLRKRRASKCSATVTSQTVRHNSTPKAQDIKMRSPSIDASSPSSSITVGNNVLHSPPNNMSHPIPPPFPNAMFGMPPPVFLENNHINDHRHPIFAPRPFLPPGMMPQERPRLFPPLNYPPLGQTPPVTVLVPYPVILPIPLPIPIPIPLTSFMQAHRASKVKTETNNDDTEGPLDFTMNGDKKKNEENISNVLSESLDADINDQSNDINERIEDLSNESIEINPEHTLPKFKITRLGNKMAKIVAKPRESAESSRPLRKRRRLVEATDDDSLIPKSRKIVQV